MFTELYRGRVSIDKNLSEAEIYTLANDNRLQWIQFSKEVELSTFGKVLPAYFYCMIVPS